MRQHRAGQELTSQHRKKYNQPLTSSFNTADSSFISQKRGQILEQQKMTFYKGAFFGACALLLCSVVGIFYLSFLMADNAKKFSQTENNYNIERDELRDALDFTLGELDFHKSDKKSALENKLLKLQEQQQKLKAHHEMMKELFKEKQVKAIIKRNEKSAIANTLAFFEEQFGVETLYPNTENILTAGMTSKRRILTSDSPASQINQIRHLEDDVERSSIQQKALLASLSNLVENYVNEKAQRLRPLGVKEVTHKSQLNNISGIGGPLIDNGLTQDPFINSHVDKIDISLAKLAFINGQARKIPIGSPMKRMNISSPYGFRSDPFVKRRTMHAGVDFRARTGTAVTSTADGVVTKAGTYGGYGKLIEIKHANGFTTRYAHLSHISVKRGQKISKGIQIGKVGSTGRSTGPHLHYEVRKNNRAINPHSFVHGRV